MQFPRVVLVGKPNVGKSVLFNRLCKRRLAIVTDVPGTTRDRKEYLIESEDSRFVLVDTAGWENVKVDGGAMSEHMMVQTKTGVDTADLVLFIVEARHHLTADDLEFAHIVRKSNKKVLLVVNKSESKIIVSHNELMKLGFGDPVFISAEHNIGVFDLLTIVSENLQDVMVCDDVEQNDEEKKLSLAIVGRPNAGKSTIFNQILGFERNIVSSEPGTTRDSITYDIEYNGVEISLIDTAGLRKKNKVYEEIEHLSNSQTITAIRRANVVVIVIDATKGFEQQDLKIASTVINEGKGLVLAFNKCDLIKDKKQLYNDIQHIFEHTLTNIVDIPVIYTNAINGTGLKHMIETALDVMKHLSSRASTSLLNKWLKKTTQAHQPSFMNTGRRIKIKYITQIKSKPPTFKVFSNTKDFDAHYKRYLSGSLQKELGLVGTPIRLQFTTSDNPYSS